MVTPASRPPADATEAWEQRFRAPRTLWVQVSRERPERGLACTNRSGAYQVERWRVGGDELEPITSDPSGKTDAWLSPDGEWVVWHADRDGNEVGHFVAARWDGGEPVDLTPHLPLYASFTAAFADDGWFGAAIVGDDLAQLVVVPWSQDGPAAAPIVLDPGPGFVTQLALAAARPDGRRALAYATTAGEGLSTILRIIDTTDGTRIHEERQPPGAVTPVAWLGDGTGRLLASTTRSGALRPIVLGIDGSARDYDLADVRGDLDPVSISPDGRRALLVGSDRTVQRLHVLDLETGAHRRLERVTGTVSPSRPGVGTRFAPDGSLIVTREDGTTPPEVVAVDPDADTVVRTLIAAPEVPVSTALRSVDVPSTDGSLVQGWLAVPEGPGPFPTILETHGGPQFNESDRFHPWAQAWVDRGFAFFTLNYRGSTGFGRAYEQAIWGQPGRCELDDMVAAREWLVREGIARPDSVVPFGGSYGGYLTLLALGRRPDLWAAGVGFVAIADWRLMHEDGPSLREYQEALFGGTPDDLPDLHAEASPVTYVDRLAAPLLIIQGRNDARCPARQMEVYVDAARGLGKEIEIDWFDAGHGHGGVETRIAWCRRSVEFVERALRRPAAVAGA